MSDFFLGVDGGQSSTTALIANADGRILGRGTGGPCNHITGPEARQKFVNAVGDCLRQACIEADQDYESLHFRAACLGFSGGAEDKENYARAIIRSELWKITHDAEIALAGATGSEPGIMVIAGTGSMAFGRNAAGIAARAGGWGYLFGDEGGALYIVRQALRACLRHEEGWGEPTILTDLLLAATGASTVNQLLHNFYGLTRSQVAGYAVVVNEAAEGDDRAAIQILEESSKELTNYVCGVHRNIFEPEDRFQVSYTGGTFQSEQLRRAYSAEIHRRLCIVVSPPLMSPAAGALLEAFRLTDSTVAAKQLADQVTSLLRK